MKNPKNILITGASSGIGEALACHYAGHDVTLFLTGQNKDRLLRVKKACEEKGASVVEKIVDATDEKAMKKFVFDCFGKRPLDLVIANAGVGSDSKEEKDDHDVTRRIFAVNVGGVLNTVLPALEKMRPLKRGQIALISSLAGYRGMASAPAYSATKNAVKAWGEALRGLYAPDGIEVSTICPGFVASRITARNKFPMPFFMQAPKAAEIIAGGLAKNKSRIAFPAPMVFAAWLVGCLPIFIADAILPKLPKK